MIFKNLFSKNDKDIRHGNQIEAGTLTRKKMEEIIKKRKQISGMELEKGYDLIKKYPRSVSILGSARFKEDNIYYKKAQSLSYRIVKELGYAVITGGGPGIMEAASKGAYEAKGASIGFVIKLPKEQSVNQYLTEYVEFEYFFGRKTLLYFATETYIYFPGGFGTFDELFEIITLIQTKKINGAPVILVGKEFWTPFLDLIKQKLAIENNTIDMIDTEIYKMIDSEDEIIDIIKKAPYREE
ncbi:MAG: TIGR00730 family Rossman fold protein [bacterium]